MKNLLMLCMFILFFSVSAMAESRAKVCVARDAHGDITDKFPVHITMDKRELFHLMGGGEKCLSFLPSKERKSKFFFTAYSPNLSNPSNPSMGVTHSEVFVVNISDGEEVILQVEPIPFTTQFPELWKLSIRP